MSTWHLASQLCGVGEQAYTDRDSQPVLGFLSDLMRKNYSIVRDPNKESKNNLQVDKKGAASPFGLEHLEEVSDTQGPHGIHASFRYHEFKHPFLYL